MAVRPRRTSQGEHCALLVSPSPAVFVGRLFRRAPSNICVGHQLGRSARVSPRRGQRAGLSADASTLPESFCLVVLPASRSARACSVWGGRWSLQLYRRNFRLAVTPRMGCTSRDCRRTRQLFRMAFACPPARVTPRKECIVHSPLRLGPYSSTDSSDGIPQISAEGISLVGCPRRASTGAKRAGWSSCAAILPESFSLVVRPSHAPQGRTVLER